MHLLRNHIMTRALRAARATLGALLPLLALSLSACDSMFTEPGPAPRAALAISYQPEPEGSVRNGGADAAPASTSVYTTVDQARVRLKDPETGATAADTLVTLDPDEAETRVRIAVDAAYSGKTLLLVLDLLSDGIIVARGSSAVEPHAGSTTPVSVTTKVMVGSVVVTPASDSVQVGATRQLSAQVLDPAGNPIAGRTVTWSSSSNAVATVSSTGLVTGAAPGTATITATHEGRSGTATLVVTPPPVATVTVSPDSATITVGHERLLSATLRDASGNLLTGRAVTWTSSNTAVATVGESGLVAAVAEGTATITATSEGRSGVAEVTVSAPAVLELEQLSIGYHTTCGITSARNAYCWGNNVVGQLGDGTTTNRLTPTPVSGGLTFTNLDAAAEHTCGIVSAGATYCWGDNGSGRLGDGTITDRLTPTQVSGGLTFTSVTPAGLHTCAITSAGAAYCWGNNVVGQLGDGSTTNRLTPTPVSGGLTFTSVAAGPNHTCGITSAGAAYCWGYNEFGSLGDETTTNRSTPTPVSGGLTFTSVDAGSNHTCGVTSAGATYCWGGNQGGQLGDGTTTDRLTPTQVSGGLTFRSVDVGYYYTCGITSAGATYCWGINVWGQLGDGTTTHRLTPNPVVPPQASISASLSRGVHRTRP